MSVVKAEKLWPNQIQSTLHLGRQGLLALWTRAQTHYVHKDSGQLVPGKNHSQTNQTAHSWQADWPLSARLWQLACQKDKQKRPRDFLTPGHWKHGLKDPVVHMFNFVFFVQMLVLLSPGLAKVALVMS